MNIDFLCITVFIYRLLYVYLLSERNFVDNNVDWWTFQESKRAFLHNIVNEEGEKGKLECFVNFCEDTIFEVRFRRYLELQDASGRDVSRAAWTEVLSCWIMNVYVECHW